MADEHVAVRQAIGRIEEAGRAGGERAELARLVAALHGVLREHFRQEERDEYFGAAFLDDPVARGRIDQLILQHREFLGRLGVIERALAEEPAVGGEDPESLFGELEALFGALRWHDAVETGLMQRLGHG